MGTAYYFNGSNAYVIIPNTQNLLVGTTALTLEAWVRHSAIPSSWRNIISKGSNPLCIQHSGDGKYFEFAIGTSTGRTYIWSTTRVDLNLGKWFNVVGVWQSPNMKIYVNGTLETTGSRDGTFTDSGYSFAIGYDPSGNSRYFNGLIAIVRIYNRALSDTEVQQIYNTPNNPPTTGLVLWFSNPDFTNDCCKAIWRDKSGNGNNGQLYNVQMAYY